jgi:hypothetical protein
MTIVVIGTTWYITLALRGIKVKPVHAAWIVNSAATILSFLTYLTAPKHSIVSNAYNAASVLTINSILVTSIILARREKKGLHFSPFQKKCLKGSLLIAIFWIVLVWGFHGTGIIPNLMTQVMMVIGYIMIGERLWGATENTESLFGWWCTVLSSSAGLVTAIISADWLASIFAGRTFIGSLILVSLMHCAERRSRLARKENK